MQLSSVLAAKPPSTCRSNTIYHSLSGRRFPFLIAVVVSWSVTYSSGNASARSAVGRQIDPS